jgi:hypothetical protein
MSWQCSSNGSIEEQGSGMSLHTFIFRGTPAGILDYRLEDLVEKKPLLFLPLLYAQQPDLALTGIYVYSEAETLRFEPGETASVVAGLRKALDHNDARVRCAALQTLMDKCWLDVRDIAAGLDDKAVIIRNLTAMGLDKVFRNRLYPGCQSSSTDIEARTKRNEQIKTRLAPVLLDHLNDTCFFVRQACASLLREQCHLDIKKDQAGKRFDWVRADWQSRANEQERWKRWWQNKEENALGAN